MPKSLHQANLFNSASTLVVAFLSPVLIPYENLPRLLQLTSKLLPTSYASAALRKCLVGMTGWEMLRDTAVLFAFTTAFLYLATKKLDWRAE